MHVTSFFSISYCSNSEYWTQKRAQVQIKAPDPYLPNKRRTDLGMLVVLSGSSSVTCIDSSRSVPVLI